MRSSPEYVRQMLAPHFPEHSVAAKYWDSLSPAWRGVVLHAASICGKDLLSSSLTNCNWDELHARVSHVEMMQLRSGIERAISIFKGFGSLRKRDFAPRAAFLSDRKPTQQRLNTAPELPESTANILASRNQLRQHKTQGHQA